MTRVPRARAGHARARIDAECQCPRAIDSLTLDSLGFRYTSALHEPANESLIVSPIPSAGHLIPLYFSRLLGQGRFTGATRRNWLQPTQMLRGDIKEWTGMGCLSRRDSTGDKLLLDII
jgi:hypothetical protein